MPCVCSVIHFVARVTLERSLNLVHLVPSEARVRNHMSIQIMCFYIFPLYSYACTNTVLSTGFIISVFLFFFSIISFLLFFFIVSSRKFNISKFYTSRKYIKKKNCFWITQQHSYELLSRTVLLIMKCKTHNEIAVP